MDAAWARWDVSAWHVRSVQQTGSTPNLWLEQPAPDGALWLHKDTLIPENGIEQGEDWSEIISTQVARALGVPVADTRLCVRDGRRGSLSRSVRPAGLDLWEGTVVLQTVGSPGYVPHREGEPAVDPGRPEVSRPGHSLENVRDALRDVQAPETFAGPADGVGGFEVFAGYMILDALIANRDRHEQNWAVLVPSLLSGTKSLAPSYDHASSLGYNLQDERRQVLLSSTDRLQSWAEKGTAYRFEHVGAPATLLAHAAAAVDLCSSEGANWWRERLMQCDLESIQEALRGGIIGGMSEPAARFADALLDLNLRRLRNAICNHA